jgi:hypothetical protein
VLQRFDSSENPGFARKPPHNQQLAFLQNRESEGFFGKIEKLQHFRGKSAGRFAALFFSRLETKLLFPSLSGKLSG